MTCSFLDNVDNTSTKNDHPPGIQRLFPTVGKRIINHGTELSPNHSQRGATTTNQGGWNEDTRSFRPSLGG